ncbi:DUF4175 family protein [Mucilaginibacter ginkgonis]|uniref:DUF4175 family protein n=1 Tax=Mucilaginibacter ginkgonis TaxID=2682091 RepID=A0A6I4I018_9SPHI|nr:DUF4175 family protein [Mucilaginibacter ginkgonis]QQL49815.1 DUF4175 family protein [Mucilaginibacter ginkgonis]
MAEGANKIATIRRRWVMNRVNADLILCFAIAFAVGTTLHIVFGLSYSYAIPVFLFAVLIVGLIHRFWKVQTNQVLAFLDQTYPQLEESSSLALKPADSLSLLERLQVSKVQNALRDVPNAPAQLRSTFKVSIIALFTAVVFSQILTHLPVKWYAALQNFAATSTLGAKNLPPEKILPEISSADIRITPPAYTGRSLRTQSRFTIDAEEGSTISWNLETNLDVKDIKLIFDEKQVIAMRAGKDKRHWSAAKGVTAGGSYQVNIDGKLSDLYAININKDAPPVIRIKTPKQYTHIEAGRQPIVNIAVSVNDDYGVAGSIIGATVATGSGEAVKFKEYKLNFDQSFSGHDKDYSLSKTLDLSKLGMAPGDELYFYIQAVDTHQQVSKTDVYIVSIQDTAALLTMDGIVSGVNLKPEFFRSERQIIIDSQNLLHARDSISRAEFNKRSNELATDQKLLRLRYGKFLGEEDESNIGEEAGSDLGKAENFSNAGKIMDAYTDKHDNAEDATFLEPTAKAQLKATLSEMWKAELQLRLYKPQDALPFEFKALTLLKDLQQKSRSYVAKTGYKTTPLKPEKRLTGDLTKIAQPVAHEDAQQQPDKYAALQKAVVILEQLKTDANLSSADKHSLQIAAQQVGAKASTDPRGYLPAVTAFKNILSGKLTPANIARAETGIQKLLPARQQMPTSTSGTDFGLSQGYFKNLSKINR